VSLSVWVVIAILVLANAVYVAAEFGAVGVRRSRVQRLSEDGHYFARQLLPFIQSPTALDRYVGASQIGITLSSLVLGAYAQATVGVALAPVLASAFGFDPLVAQSVSAVAVLTTLTSAQVVIGELVPKSLALQFPTEVALLTLLPMRASLVVFAPLLAVVNGSATALLRLFGLGAGAHRHLHSPDEIDLMIAESRDGGLLEPEEQQRLRRALWLGRRTAQQFMVPLSRLTMVAADATADELVTRATESTFTRLPVYRGSRDEIAGMVLVKDVLHRYVTDGAIPSVERLMRPMPRVRHDLPADQVLGVLRAKRSHQAAVTDEQDRVVGLVTVQDVLSQFLVAGPDRPEARRG
jgi:CBS domain containing-hemolysin-like protein